MDMTTPDNAFDLGEAQAWEGAPRDIDDVDIEGLVADALDEAARAPYDARMSHHGSLIDFLPATDTAPATWALRFRGSIRATYPDLGTALAANRHAPVRAEALREALRQLARLAAHRIVGERDPVVSMGAMRAAGATRPVARSALSA